MTVKDKMLSNLYTSVPAPNLQLKSMFCNGSASGPLVRDEGQKPTGGSTTEKHSGLLLSQFPFGGQQVGTDRSRNSYQGIGINGKKALTQAHTRGLSGAAASRRNLLDSAEGAKREGGLHKIAEGNEAVKISDMFSKSLDRVGVRNK